MLLSFKRYWFIVFSRRAVYRSSKLEQDRIFTQIAFVRSSFSTLPRHVSISSCTRLKTWNNFDPEPVSVRIPFLKPEPCSAPTCSSMAFLNWWAFSRTPRLRESRILTRALFSLQTQISQAIQRSPQTLISQKSSFSWASSSAARNSSVFWSKLSLSNLFRISLPTSFINPSSPSKAFPSSSPPNSPAFDNEAWAVSRALRRRRERRVWI